MTKLCLKGMTMLLLVLMAQYAQSQIGQTYFHYLNPKPTGIQVNNVSFADNNNGIAVGNNGGILKTTDGGATWQYGVFTFLNASGFIVKPTLYNCHFVSATIAYAVGEYGLFLKSTDGGMNWTMLNNPYTDLGSTSIYPAAVFFTSPTTGYMGGTRNSTITNTAPYLYKTMDGGITWDSIPAPLGDSTFYGSVASPTKFGITNENKRILAIKFIDANTGYISGSGGIPSGQGINAAANHTLLWKFTNGSLKDYSVTKEKLIPHWVPNASGNYSQFTPTSQNYWGLQPLNDSVVFLSAQNNGIMYRVKTGVNDKTADFVHPGEFVDGIYEMISGSVSSGGTPPIAATQFPANSSMWRMAKGPDDKVYVTYGTNVLGGLVNYTADAGDTWEQIPTSPGNFLSAIDVTPEGRIVTLGGNGFITDSLPGQSRRTVYTNFAENGFASTNAMEVADCNNIVAVGGFGSIAASTDGGLTWTDKTNPSLASSLFSFYGLSLNNSTKMFASGTASGNGYVYGSADMGTTLDLLLTVPPANGANTTVFGLSSIGDSIWVAGRRAKTSAPAFYGDYVYRSFDGGLTWDTITVETGTVSSAIISSQQVRFTTKDTGYYFGIGSFSVSGKIYKTTDAGATWADITPTTLPAGTHNWVHMSVVGKDTLFVGGYAGNVYKSVDAGITWTHIPIIISTESLIGNISGILFHDSQNGYASGNSGRIFITNDGGATWRTDHAPNSLIYTIGRFTQPNVPANTPFANRKVIIGSASNEFYEYGDPLAINVSSTETVVDASCTNTTGGSITINATGGIAPYTYSIDGTTFQTSNVFSNLSQGDKTITIKESACGRTITKTVTVGFTDNMTVTASNDTTVCAGAPVQLTAVAPTGSSFSWSPASGLSASNISNPIATPTNNIQYTVTATLGTCTKTDDVVISIKPSPAVSAGQDKTIYEGDQVQLDGSAQNNSTIAWTPANSLSNPAILNPYARPAQTTTYTLSVKNSDNCTSTDDVTLTVISNCIKIMNAFTPNRDGANDLWIVTNGTACTNRIKAVVYNRYGQQVYINDAYQNNWDGTYNGKPVPDGTYYYSITFFLINGRQVNMKGDVTILR